MLKTEALHILQLNNSFTLEDLQKAYRKQAPFYHPDCGGSHEQFIQLTEAYNYLKDNISLEVFVIKNTHSKWTLKIEDFFLKKIIINITQINRLSETITKEIDLYPYIIKWGNITVLPGEGNWNDAYKAYEDLYLDIKWVFEGIFVEPNLTNGNIRLKKSFHIAQVLMNEASINWNNETIYFKRDEFFSLNPLFKFPKKGLLSKWGQGDLEIQVMTYFDITQISDEKAAQLVSIMLE